MYGGIPIQEKSPIAKKENHKVSNLDHSHHQASATPMAQQEWHWEINQASALHRKRKSHSESDYEI